LTDAVVVTACFNREHFAQLSTALTEIFIWCEASSFPLSQLFSLILVFYDFYFATADSQWII